MKIFTAALVRLRVHLALLVRHLISLAREIARKARFLARQPEGKMVMIIQKGLALVSAEIFFLHLPTVAIAGWTFPYAFTALGVLGLACAFRRAFRLKSEADQLPSLWVRVKAA